MNTRIVLKSLNENKNNKMNDGTSNNNNVNNNNININPQPNQNFYGMNQNKFIPNINEINQQNNMPMKMNTNQSNNNVNMNQNKVNTNINYNNNNLTNNLLNMNNKQNNINMAINNNINANFFNNNNNIIQNNFQNQINGNNFQNNNNKNMNNMMNNNMNFNGINNMNQSMNNIVNQGRNFKVNNNVKGNINNCNINNNMKGNICQGFNNNNMNQGFNNMNKGFNNNNFNINNNMNNINKGIINNMNNMNQGNNNKINIVNQGMNINNNNIMNNMVNGLNNFKMNNMVNNNINKGTNNMNQGMVNSMNKVINNNINMNHMNNNLNNINKANNNILQNQGNNNIIVNNNINQSIMNNINGNNNMIMNNKINNNIHQGLNNKNGNNINNNMNHGINIMNNCNIVQNVMNKNVNINNKNDNIDMFNKIMNSFQSDRKFIQQFNIINNNQNMINIINKKLQKRKNICEQDLLKQQEFDSFKNEIENIDKQLEEVFSLKELKKIQSEENLLNFFSEKEKECIEYVNDKFGGEPFLKDIMINGIKEIFDENPIIHPLTESVNLKINDIPLQELKSEKEFYSKLKIYFNDIKLPDFLLNGPLLNLKSILFYQKRTESTSTIDMKKKKGHINSKLLNSSLEDIKQNQNLFLEKINNKYELFYLFIIVNYLNLKKKFWNQFLILLSINETIIKQFIGNNFNYNQISKDFIEIQTESESPQEKRDILFQIVQGDINNDMKNVFNIIASFYYLLFYQFKSRANANELSNIGNTLINIILKNFVIFLDKKYKNVVDFGDNLYELFKELIVSDTLYLVHKNFYPERNAFYNFFDIDDILLKCPRVRNSYDALKKKYAADQTGFFEAIKLGDKRDFSTFEQYLKLIPCDEYVFTNTITIIIDGFTTEENNPMDNWKDFIDYFHRKSMFYFYKWPSDSLKNILSNGIKKLLTSCSMNFFSASYRAEVCGKILAYIIYSNEIFKNFQINLVGFSLGNNVIKYCIKELNELNNSMKNINYGNLFIDHLKENKKENYEINLKNVILIAAATHFKYEDKWAKYGQETIVDQFTNCYSNKDWVLCSLYKLCMLKNAIGSDELKLLYERKNFVNNFDFTRDNFGHLSYNMDILAKRISQKYSDI